MGSIVAHLANYNQPHVQCYIVRILWMVPLYSMESWLCLRFHEYAIYIETLRDCYESFVLYSFLQFLIEVLGGEEALILMLKDKSPTRGSHMWGLQWCVKPWLMGQPVRRSEDDKKVPSSPIRDRHGKSPKRVHWTSPFFVQCKFGVLQYVLLKFVCSFLAMILETHGIYKEGDFTYKGGYLYICVVTNLSQCWALYCLILFYYATHNELGPIRPVGKFLSVKALVFFTWWQSVAIGIMYQMNLIPEYEHTNMSREDVAKGIQDYLICVEMFFAAICHTLVFPHTEYSPQAVKARARALNQSATNPGVWQQRKRLGRHHQYHTTQVLRNYHHNRDDKSANSGSKSSFTGGDRSFFDLEMTTLSSGGAGTGTASWEETETVGDDGHAILLPLNTNRIRGDSVDSDLSPMAVDRQEWSSQPRNYPGWEALTNNDDELLEAQLDDPHVPAALLQPSLQERHGTIEEGADEDDQWETGDDDDEEDFSSEASDDTGLLDGSSVGESRPRQKQSFVRAFLDSAIPRDLRDNTVGIVKGDYVVEKKTLLHHATTSDHYDLFSHGRRFRAKDGKDKK
jgi:Organic solute transporter Ostalpha